MLLLDHFHPPLSIHRHWEALHTRWATAMADVLNEDWLPSHLFAEPQIHVTGQVQVDVGTFEGDVAFRGAAATATLASKTWTAPPATWTMPAVFSDTFEVQIINTEGGPKLVASIELVSPGNKDRPETRRTFALKCLSYLAQGISLIVVDVVTSRLANLHNEAMRIMQADSTFRLPEDAGLYAVAYRPLTRDSKDQIDVWPTALKVGEPLPVLPLTVSPELTVPINLDETYREACERLRLQ